MIFALLFFLTSPVTYSYWVQPCVADALSGCQAEDRDLASWALEAWQAASGGATSPGPAYPEKLFIHGIEYDNDFCVCQPRKHVGYTTPGCKKVKEFKRDFA